MTLLPQKLLARLATRLRRSRPGSVLIIVIVLLLLLAILGATYISTTRSARVASAQNVLSDDVDDTLNGLAKICDGIIVDDLNDSLGNLRGVDAGVTQYMNSAYQGVFNPAQTYNQGDVVSYPPEPAAPPFTPTNFYAYVSSAPSAGSTPSLTLSTPWALTTHVPGATSSLIQPWLAERIPTPDGPQPTPTAYWPNITQAAVPIGSMVPTSIIGVPFESPDGTAIPALTGPGYTMTGKMGSQLVPDFKTLGNVTVPALDYPTTGGAPVQLVAGDADGDGIADCLLFRVPGMSLDGLTWYAGVRIIDNNSAINANTALSRDQEYGWSAGTFQSLGANSNYYALFQSGVGLLELLNAGDTQTTNNFTNFTTYEFGNVASPSQQPYADPTPSTANPSSTPTTPIARTDFQFLTGGDALHSQLSSRIANPGFNGNGPRFQSAMPLSDEAALAYHFCLVNPETALSQVPSSLIENLLPFSLSYYQAASAGPPQTPAKYYRYIPYGGNGAADVATWFNDNFNYDAAPTDYSAVVGTQPLRPLLVSQNPVSNYIRPVYDSNVTAANGVLTGGNVGEPVDPLGIAFPNPYALDAGAIPGIMLPYGTGPANYVHFKGPWNGNTTYQINDIVIGADGYTYICVGTPTPNAAPSLATLYSTAAGSPNYLYWQFQPWTKSPVKANVNTATFRELYRAFWSVMAGNPSGQTPFGPDATTVDLNPYWPDTALAYNVPNPQHEFRSPLRDPTYVIGDANPTRLSPSNTMLLRAALAAVNTLGLRDNSQNVISRTVYLNAIIPSLSANPTPVMARVYSSAPAPVISEVYANTYTGSDTGTGTANPQGYVAIELYNPYPTTLVLTNWQLGLVTRLATGGTYPKLVFQTTSGTPVGASIIGPMQVLNDPTVAGAAGTLPAGYPIKIPPHGYALLENYNGSLTTPADPTHDAACRSYGAVVPPLLPTEPGSFYLTTTGAAPTGIWYGPNGPGNAATPATTCDVFVPNLQLVISSTTGASIPGSSLGGEIVLLRPRRCDGVYSASADPLNTFTEGTPTAPYLYDLVPVDSYDFDGLAIGSPAIGSEWSYVRIKGANPATWFKQIYPGRYSTIGASAPARETGTLSLGITSAIQNPAWTSGSPTTIDNTPKFGEDATIASYINSFPPIQVYNFGIGANSILSHWPNATLSPVTAGSTVTVTNTAGKAQAPFGTFARNGDMLDIPFVGAYRITIAGEGNTPTDFVEVNSLPMDCSFADATYNDTTDTTDQNVENIGRFCPIQARTSPAAGWAQPDYYAWARNLFAYLTVQSPNDARLPNFDPNINDVASYPNGAPTPVPNNYKYPAGQAPPTQQPSIALSADATASDQTSQGNVGVEGLININTASWKVLSMLPMVTKSEDNSANYTKDNESLAKAIVTWRLTHGPFTSIYDLNSVVDYNPANAGPNASASSPAGFMNAEGWLNPAKGGQAGGVSTMNGLLCPPDSVFPSATNPPVVPTSSSYSGSATGLTEDYQADFAILNRISNLVTTRSDTFTIYIVVQGWQNVGAGNAQPVVTRRFAYIVDRNGVNADPSTRYLKTLVVPNN